MAYSSRLVLRRSLFVLFTLGGLLGAGAALAGSPEYNTSPGPGNFSFYTKYPSYSAANTCSSCHTTAPALNVYGTAYKTAYTATSGTLRPTPQPAVGPALTQIEPLDSDGDGYSNITEINALRRAYDATDHPTAAVSLSTAQSAKSGTASSTVAYTVTVTNNGNITDSFTLGVSVFSGQSWIPSIVGAASGVAPAGTAGITVNVAIPGGASGGQTSVARVTAVSQANASISATPLDLTTTPPVIVVGARYVNAATGSDTTDCRTQGTPCKTITYAMSQAATGNPGDPINVAPGTYNVALGEVFPIAIKSGIQLQATNGPGNTIVDATGANARVFNASASNSSTLLQGFKITGGFHQPPADGSNGQGGAIFIDNLSAIKIRRSVFTGNEARGYAGAPPTHPTGGEAYGGAISATNSSPSIKNNVFNGNTVQGGNGLNKVDGTTGGSGGSGHGGAISIGGGSSSGVNNNTFYGNFAKGGAGGSSNAVGGGPGGQGFDGAVEASNSSITDNIFVNNSAVAGAGGGGSPPGSPGTAFAGALTFQPNPGPDTPTSNLFFGNSSDGDTGITPVFQDPLFHLAPSNLHIRLSSPAGGAGTLSGAATNDFDGVTRPNPPSIGAFEPSGVASTTALVSSVNPSTVGQSVTFTATVSGSSGTPTGTATFKDATTVLCTATTLATGQAQCASSALSQATHSMTAEYSGDATYAASISPALSQVVQAAPAFMLTVSPGGAGTGTVTSSPAGISCGATCAASFNSGSAVTLTAAASAGSTFGGWSGGGCSGTGGCTVTMNAATAVTATFNVAPAGTFALTVGKNGTGAGTVTSSPGSISCGSTCVASFNSGTVVMLSAAATSGSFFAGWSGGGCSGTGGCTVTMSAATSVTATFSLTPVGSFALTVTKAGLGSGTVTSSPAGIACGSTCVANFSSGTVVTLSAAASASTFIGWSGGGCSGTGTCIATLNADVGVTATFTPNPPRLANISTRGQVQTGFDVMIGGFVISGSTAKTVVVRAIGPSLANFGVSGALSNPTLQLVRSSDQSTVATNDDWGSAANAAQISSSGFAPSNPLESAIYATLQPGAYTAIVSGVGGATGVGLVEVYEVDHPEIALINISTRGKVQTGFDVMIGGFVVQGSGPQTVVIRAIGPSLANFGVSGALANPTMSLVRMSDNATIATNDDWGNASNAAQISSSARSSPGPTPPLCRA